MLMPARDAGAHLVLSSTKAAPVLLCEQDAPHVGRECQAWPTGGSGDLMLVENFR